MIQGNGVFCDICMTKNDFDDSFCRECGEKLETMKSKSSQFENIHRNILKIDRKFVNSINSSVYEKDNEHIKYEVKNKINFSDKIYITFVFIYGTLFTIILLALLVPLEIIFKNDNITLLFILIDTIILIIISFVMIQLTINKTVKINIRSHHYDKNVGIIKAKGFMQKHWMFFDTNGHEIYSIEFRTRKMGILFGKKEKYRFSILNKDLLNAKAVNDDETMSINVLSGQKIMQTINKSNIRGRKNFTIDSNENIDDSLVLFFGLVVAKRNG